MVLALAGAIIKLSPPDLVTLNLQNFSASSLGDE